jgi:hypothetical protein
MKALFCWQLSLAVHLFRHYSYLLYISLFGLPGEAGLIFISCLSITLYAAAL